MMRGKIILSLSFLVFNWLREAKVTICNDQTNVVLGDWYLQVLIKLIFHHLIMDSYWLITKFQLR